MELRVLKYFVTIIQEGNISKAAKVLHVSQSTLSRQIQDLEYELDTLLLERKKKPIGLTDEGSFLYARAQEVLQIINDTTKVIRDNELVTGELEIGVGENYMSELVAKICGKLVGQYMDIKVNIHNIASDLIPDEINRGTLDFGFVTSQNNLADYHQLNINYKDQWGILVNKGQMSRNIVVPSDLIGNKIILPRQHALITWLRKWLGGEKEEIRFVGTYDMMQSMHSMVRNNVGIAVTFDKNQYHQVNSEFTFIPLDNFPSVPAKLIWKKGRLQSQLEKIFVNEVKNVIS